MAATVYTLLVNNSSINSFQVALTFLRFFFTLGHVAWIHSPLECHSLIAQFTHTRSTSIGGGSNYIGDVIHETKDVAPEIGGNIHIKCLVSR